MQINASETPKKFHRKQISENKKAHTRDGLYYEFLGEYVQAYVRIYIFIISCINLWLNERQNLINAKYDVSQSHISFRFFFSKQNRQTKKANYYLWHTHFLLMQYLY